MLFAMICFLSTFYLTFLSQWHFVQATTCLPPGYGSFSLQGFGINTALPSCSDPGQYPNEAWACADIAVVGERDLELDESQLCNKDVTAGCKVVFGYVTNWYARFPLAPTRPPAVC
jgi:hypothetical protein